MCARPFCIQFCVQYYSCAESYELHLQMGGRGGHHRQLPHSAAKARDADPSDGQRTSHLTQLAQEQHQMSHNSSSVQVFYFSFFS
jgi:hypothetical protein